MSQTSMGIIAAAGLALTLGAVPLAAGRDLAAGLQNPWRVPATTTNRAAKADRAAAMVRSAVPTRTISLQPDGLSDTSVLVRIPVARAGRSGVSAPSQLKPGNGKRTVACEPVVSVLTEVAKLLQPGRCLT